MPALSVMTAIVFFLMPVPAALYNDSLEPIAYLPAGYFVMQSGESAPDGFIAVVYDELNGYVKAAEVTEVDYTPVTKYETTVRFTCDNDGQPVNLREKPQRSSPVIAVMPPKSSGRVFGTMDGDALIPGADTLWYYVKYGDSYGYCYYAHLSVEPFPPNIIEKEPEPQAPANAEGDPDENEQKQFALSKTSAIILIVVLCIPVPFIMLYLIKKPKNE